MFTEDTSLSAPIRSSGRDSLGNAIFVVDQDVLTAEAEFDAEDASLTSPMLASAPLFSALVLCLDTDRLEVN